MLDASFDAPFVDPRGKSLRQLDLQTERVSLHRVEGGPIVLVACASKAAWIRDRLPFSVFAIEQLPGFRDPAFAATGVVEPIYLDGGNFGRLGEIILHPFAGSFVRPPMKIPAGVVVRVARLTLVVERPDIRPDTLIR